MKTLDSVWDVYKPGDAMPWDLRRVVHLHRRAGFAATWDELQRDLQGRARAEHRPAARGQGIAARRRPSSLPPPTCSADAAVAAGRVRPAARPGGSTACCSARTRLGERLTLMWHDHFATSNAKVEDLALMRRQNETFRKLAPGTVRRAAERRRPRPGAACSTSTPRPTARATRTRTSARELMELFTLGVGHYTEADVKEAARCPDRLDGRGRQVRRGARTPRRRREDDPRPEGRTGRAATW